MGGASNCVGQVQPMKVFTLEDCRLKTDGVNSWSFLAATSSTARSLSWLVH